MWPAVVVAVVVAGCQFRHGQAEPDVQTARDATVDVAPDASPAPPFAMAGQRWLLPCLNNLGNYNCNCAATPVQQTVTIAGTQRWQVTIRIRGVMEAIGYSGGTAGSGGWYVGGIPGDGADNTYELTVSTPSQHFYLNLGAPTGQQSFVYDFTAMFEVDGGATITFIADGQDGLQWGNYGPSHTPWTIPGVTTTPSPYDGQFAQLDVLDAIAL
jgi:hypothetical protein